MEDINWVALMVGAIIGLVAINVVRLIAIHWDKLKPVPRIDRTEGRKLKKKLIGILDNDPMNNAYYMLTDPFNRPVLNEMATTHNLAKKFPRLTYLNNMTDKELLHLRHGFQLNTVDAAKKGIQERLPQKRHKTRLSEGRDKHREVLKRLNTKLGDRYDGKIDDAIARAIERIDNQQHRIDEIAKNLKIHPWEK